VRSHIREARAALASILFPAPCRICGRILDTGGRIPFCGACRAGLAQTLPEPLCTRCGRPIVSAAVLGGISQPQCHLCRSGVYAFDLARSFGAYNPAMARAILLLKYGNVTPLGAWFAGLLAGLAERQLKDVAADAVVPVPLDPGRL
jgi:predicted amidophosphoribosyltransferase